MEITYTWSINNMQHSTPNGGVISVGWSCLAEGGGTSWFWDGRSEFTPDPSAEDFVPYAELTEKIVMDWVLAKLGDEKEVIEAMGAEKINEQLNPSVEGGLPW